jgi:hypothetical protein
LELIPHLFATTRTESQKFQSVSFFCCEYTNWSQGGNTLARQNYQFNKRQKEIAKKKKKEEKRQRKLEKNTIESEENPDGSQNEEENQLT